jgi:hypothetical protein
MDTGIVPGTIVESHRDADKEEDKLLYGLYGTKWMDCFCAVAISLRIKAKHLLGFPLYIAND